MCEYTGSCVYRRSFLLSYMVLARNRTLCQVFDCPLGIGPSPPVIVAKITRLGNRPSLSRATAPATRSRPLRMVHPMLSHRRVLLRTFAYERVLWSVRCRRWQPMTHSRTWLFALRSLMKWFGLRAGGTHPTRTAPSNSRVSITSAFSMRTFFAKRGGRHAMQLLAESFEAYNSTRTSQIRRSISSEGGQRFSG